MIRLGFRQQRTIARPAELRGVGFITGASVRICFLPSGPNSGIVFRRIDRPRKPWIPACVEQVSGVNRRTTLGTGSDQVTLAEHVLSALSGMRIDNCLIEIDGPEPPGLDGSADGFCQVLAEAGIAMQSGRRDLWTVREPLVLSQGGATLALHPLSVPELRISYSLDYGLHAPIPPQTHTETMTAQTYRSEISRSRTFVLEAEARELQSQGVGRHLTEAELLVFGPYGVIGNTLRHPDEPARHKILDVIGDLALCGVDLAGHVVAYRSGHPLNVELARQISQAVCRDSAVPRGAARAA